MCFVVVRKNIPNGKYLRDPLRTKAGGDDRGKFHPPQRIAWWDATSGATSLFIWTEINHAANEWGLNTSMALIVRNGCIDDLVKSVFELQAAPVDA